MPSRRTTNILVFIVLLVIVGSVLKLGLGGSSLDPSALVHHGADQDEPDHWEWETTTRFLENHDAKSTFSMKDDHLCDAFPSYLLDRIQVVLKIGASEPADRVNAQMTTVTRCIDNLIVFSDRDSELNGHHVYDILATLPASFRANTSDFEAYEALQRGDGKSVDGGQGWRLDRFKFLPMVERAYEMNPTAEWYVFLESDTYFVWDNLFRLLDQFDPTVPLYFGSPSPGRHVDEKTKTYFAYGGAGFVLSHAAAAKLVVREVGRHGEYIQPPLSQQYEEIVKADCCGDSVLGWVLYQHGVKLSGLWPLFSPHPLHGIPFDNAYWCQPVISMHKSLLSDMEGLIKFENQRSRKTPLLYSDLLEYLKLGTIDRKTDWDNGDWGGWQEPPESPGHKSFEDCAAACHEHPECMSYTYDHSGHCVFVRTIRLGTKKPSSGDTRLSAGWDLTKVNEWRATHQCENALWMKPSLTRIF